MKNNLKLEENVNYDTTIVTKKSPNVNEWKDIGKVSGIYKIINKINGKYYIGSSKNINRRWNEHRSELNRNVHKNSYLQNAWNKYGEKNFEFVIFNKPEKLKLLEIEQKYLDEIKNNRKNLCYNLTFNTCGSPCENETSRLKMVNSLKNYYKHHKPAFYGKHHTEECKKKMSGKRPKFCGEGNSKFNRNIYHFLNILTKETFTGTQFDFRKKYNLLPSCVSELVRKKAKSTKGWVLIKTNRL
jgi:group I intron endonuclease